VTVTVGTLPIANAAPMYQHHHVERRRRRHRGQGLADARRAEGQLDQERERPAKYGIIDKAPAYDGMVRAGGGA
jgi:hypothetical protein